MRTVGLKVTKKPEKAPAKNDTKKPEKGEKDAK